MRPPVNGEAPAAVVALPSVMPPAAGVVIPPSVMPPVAGVTVGAALPNANPDPPRVKTVITVTISTLIRDYILPDSNY